MGCPVHSPAGSESLLHASPFPNLKDAWNPDSMHLLLLCLLVLLPLGRAAQPLDGRQSQNSVSLVLLERNRRELPMGNHEEAEEKPDLFVAVPHLIGASAAGEGHRQREKMLFKFSRFWKKPERELYPTQDPVSEHFPLGTQALTQSKDRMQMKKSPLQEEAKKFWHHFMFRMSPASQGVILPIKSHEVHQETCRTVPFSQVSVPGGERGRGLAGRGWTAGTGGEEGKRLSASCVLPNSQTWSLGVHHGI